MIDTIWQTLKRYIPAKWQQYIPLVLVLALIILIMFPSLFGEATVIFKGQILTEIANPIDTVTWVETVTPIP